MVTETLRAYAMYDVGDGFLWNEMAYRDEILEKSGGIYKVFAVWVDNIQENENIEELGIGLEKIIPCLIRYGPHHELKLFCDKIINNFLDDTDVDKPIDLLNRKLIALFHPENKLQWLIAYPISITQDDVNITKIDAEDFSYLS